VFLENVEGKSQQDSKTGPDRNVEGNEPVWTFRGFRLGPSEFTTSMVHLFRAEINRANVWRQRLDTTTNWAVVLTVAVISVAFSGPTGHHSVIILSTILITLFLFIEARRYRYYELWSSRVRLMETDFYAAMLVPPFHPDPDWAESLAESLLQPQFPISMWEAFGRRFRHNYLWIYLILALAWFAKIWFQPTVAQSWLEVLDRARIGAIPGEVVLILGVAFNGALMLIGLLTLGLQEASGEVLPRYFSPQETSPIELAATANGNRMRAWFRRTKRRRQLMALIITDKGTAVARSILEDMHRGVTSLAGKGMYTGKEHSVLMCALTVTEVRQLKSLVKSADPMAFVIVTPVQEILGGEFAPLEEEKTKPVNKG
jgi:uncharacterized membrane protein